MNNRTTEEVWQTQRYWPIKGWTSLSGFSSAPQYENLYGKVYEKLPNQELLADGWQWINEWSVDMSKSFGECDVDGWTYAATLDGLLEAFSNGNTCGEMTALSLVRRRRYVRHRICISQKVIGDMQSRIEILSAMSRNLKLALAAKEKELIIFQNYEKARLTVSKSGFHRINVETIQYIQDTRGVMRAGQRLLDYLLEKYQLDAEYASRLSRLSNSKLCARSSAGPGPSMSPAPPSPSSSSSLFRDPGAKTHTNVGVNM
jgi:hypothetical protein